jgi:hypothetical protein
MAPSRRERSMPASNPTQRLQTGFHGAKTSSFAAA